jgi:CRISPR-associated RAMP protein (TIGR02581 family)
MPRESLYSFAALQNRLKIAGTLVALTALRIGAGRDTEVTSNDLPVLRDALDRPFIPGASLKGTLRARIEALIRAVAQEQTSPTFTQLADLSENIRQARQRGLFSDDLLAQQKQGLKPDSVALDLEQLEDRTRVVRAFLSQNRELSDADVSDIIWRQSSMIDLTFGSPELAGRIFFKDAQVLTLAKLGLFEVRNGVAINRDTETVDGGKLYDFEVVPAGTRFQFELAMENAEYWQIGMLLLALKPWERGDVQVGGFRSRGLGYIQLVDLQRQFIEIKDVDHLIALLSDDITEDNITPEQELAWRTAFHEKLLSAVV